MSGWKIDSPKYKITEALFHEIWESLEIIADVDKDGKITKTEWVSSSSLITGSQRGSEQKSIYSKAVANPLNKCIKMHSYQLSLHSL